MYPKLTKFLKIYILLYTNTELQNPVTELPLIYFGKKQKNKNQGKMTCVLCEDVLFVNFLTKMP